MVHHDNDRRSTGAVIAAMGILNEALNGVGAYPKTSRNWCFIDNSVHTLL
jgi:hypothetical protein